MLHLRSSVLRGIRCQFIQLSIRCTSNQSIIVKSIERDENNGSDVKEQNELLPQKNILPHTVLKNDHEKNSTLVATAFASLKEKPNKKDFQAVKKTQKKNSIDEKITNATSIDSLLSISDASVISRKHALKVVSTLEEWSSSGQVNLSEFETDSRFLKLCRILARGTQNNKNPNMYKLSAAGNDLTTVLNVTGDDEAAKLIARISLPQMIKVISALAKNNRRSTPLLHSLAYNITNSEDKLDLKQSADLLYGAATLTFPDSLMIEKVCNDICLKIPDNKKSAVVGSILTSLGLLRYKNTDVLNSSAEWIVKNSEIVRPQDLFALFITHAVVSHYFYNSNDIQKILIPQLNQADALKLSVWVDVVWSLVVLNLAENKHIESVLNAEFIEKLKNENDLNISTKIKILNINAAAKLLQNNYKGETLPEDSDIYAVSIVRSREKQTFVMSMLDSLNSLLPSSTYLRSNVDTGLGFLLDGECFLDSKCNPLPVSESDESKKGIRIAFMAHDYHDLCRGNRPEPIGTNLLAKKILSAKGYSVLVVPYTEFSPRDKLVHRVRYLQSQLKEIVKTHFKS